MTPQEMFDKAYIGVLKQGRPKDSPLWQATQFEFVYNQNQSYGIARRIQSAHDSSFEGAGFVAKYTEKMTAIAADYNLIIPEVK